MRAPVASMVILFGCLGVLPALSGAPQALAQRGAGEPIFMRWLNPDDPQDQTIRYYWERSQRDELSPTQLVDLGTMLFERGWPKDAVRTYRRALDKDPKLYEAWFRMGLVKQSEGELDDARSAYKRCLKLLTGHGWCNFYLGLLEERTDHPSRALHYYRRAYKFAPELADPAINPEVLSSNLQLGALVRHDEHQQFVQAAPMSYLDPEKVAAVRQRFAEQDQEPEATPAATAPPAGVAAAPEPSPTPTPRPTAPPPPARPRRSGPARQPPPHSTATPGAARATGGTPWGMPEVPTPSPSPETHLR